MNCNNITLLVDFGTNNIIYSFAAQPCMSGNKQWYFAMIDL